MDRPNRRQFLTAAGKTLASAGLAAAVSRSERRAFAAESSERPNIVLIMTDDQGYGDLACHGNPHVRTPNIDRLHDESTRVDTFYVCPVCAPTRACLMTGRYNYRTGAIDTYRGRAMMYPDETTIAEVLSREGYATGIFGKWHLGDNYPLRPMDQGFQESLVLQGGGIGQPSNPPGNDYYDPFLLHNGELKQYEGYCTDIYTDAAMEFIEQHHEEPFFVYLPTNAPHTPLTIKDEFIEPYRAMGLSEDVAKIYAMVTNIDDNVGRVLAKLDSLNLAENTIVIFLTDNGPQGFGDEVRWNAGLRGAKGTVYEGGIRVPFFVRWPERLQAGRVVEQIGAHIDVTPTLLEACEAGGIDGMNVDGRSLLPLMVGESVSWPDRSLFFQWHRGDTPEPYNSCAVREQRYKLVNGVELYDLESDPSEAKDIASEHPEIVARLRSDYEAWFDDVVGERAAIPPRIIIGSDAENPVILTVQDQREGEPVWYGLGGYWLVEVAQAGQYEVTLRFDDKAFAGQAHFSLGGIHLTHPLNEGERVLTLPATYLPNGPATVRGWVTAENRIRGALYVEIRRVE
jgi:arylsulfatase A-like enzyme